MAYFKEFDVQCPNCGEIDDRVLESRQNSSGTSIRRRRECAGCGHRFTSYERLEDKPLMVVKNDGRRQPFNREKLERGVQRATEKRPVSQMQIEEIIAWIENETALRGRLDHEVSSEEIGELVLQRLFELDKVAYIRFASVYRDFEDLEQYAKEIKKLSKKKRREH